MGLSFASVIVSGAVALVIYKLVTWYIRYKRWAAQYDVIPGTKGHWLLGHLNEHPGCYQDGIDYLFSFVKIYPKIHKMWFSSLSCNAIVFHPDTVKPVLKASATLAPKPRELGTFYRMGLPWLGEGLLLANGERWARSRRLLTPGFHFDVLQPYVQVFNDTVELLLGKIDKFAETGDIFDMYKHCGTLALDNMLRCALSNKTDCQLREDHPYVMTVHRLTELWSSRCVNALHYIDWFYYNFTKNGKEYLRHCEYVHQVTDDIIKSRRQQLEKGSDSSKDDQPKTRYLDFLDILLTAQYEDGQKLTDLEIRSEVDTFLFEGHDTTASGLSFTLMSLAQNPSIQQKAQDEIDQLLQGRDSERIEWDDLQKLDYLTLCIKEGLRMNPPVHFVQRTIQEDMEIDGYKVPKGSAVAINIRNLHHNPAVWGDDHWDFKPERFLSEQTKDRDAFAYCPFSGGTRNCIGQNFAMNEMKVTIARILQRYTLEIAGSFNTDQVMSLIMRPVNGIQMIAKRRL